MSPKIKRRLNTFNNRYKNDGYKMEIRGVRVHLINANNPIRIYLVCELAKADGKTEFFFIMKEVIVKLNSPELITDFLYYGMAILEEMQKEQGKAGGNDTW
ncbi:hypothetical protein MASR1M107_05410 [Ignavibacteriales bacterium]